MPPVTVRYYGIMNLTRRTYLVVQSCVFIALALTLAFVLTLGPSPRFGLDEAKLSSVGRWLLDHLLFVVLITFALELLDTFFTLSAFRRKERADA